MQTTPQNPPGRGSGRGRGRGRGRGFFRRGAATAARTRPARVAPSPPIVDSPMPANGPEIVPSSTENTALSNVRFADFVARGRLSVDLAERILPFDFCTEVQAATFDNILDGRDILARAKTGTGKTLAFLLPMIQRLFHPPPLASFSPAQRSLQRPISIQPYMGVQVLVLSPTRELALQTESVARSLCIPSSWGSLSVVGGTKFHTDQKRLQTQRADVLLATPGRLLDLLENGGLAPLLSSLQCLVLDEADRLLDQGFRKDLEKIITFLPDRTVIPRQTLLFSATIPEDVRTIANIYLLPSHQYISTVAEEEESTHAHVPQKYLVAPFKNHLSILAAFIEKHLNAMQKEEGPGGTMKMMVFFPTARSTGFAAHLFDQLKFSNSTLKFFEIHSRKSQNHRVFATTGFTGCKVGVMLTSDVTARGIDIPDVTAVVQVGMPSNGEQYIHRLGRTARAGKEGSGLLLLDPMEFPFVASKGMKELPLEETTEDELLRQPGVKEWEAKIERATESVDPEVRAASYRAWLGFYKTSMRLLRIKNDVDIVRAANAYSEEVLRYGRQNQLQSLPSFERKALGRIGLSHEAQRRVNKEARQSNQGAANRERQR